MRDDDQRPVPSAPADRRPHHAPRGYALVTPPGWRAWVAPGPVGAEPRVVVFGSASGQDAAAFLRT